MVEIAVVEQELNAQATSSIHPLLQRPRTSSGPIKHRLIEIRVAKFDKRSRQTCSRSVRPGRYLTEE